MAHKLTYRCKQCGYEAEIYEGRGFMGQHIVQVSCPDCKTLQPLVVGGVIGDSAPSFRTTVGRLCLNCGSNRISLWDGKTCPKCSGEMVDTGKDEFWT
jgi:Zn finger protein HypA/HybF involved in hydrogenase expression